MNDSNKFSSSEIKGVDPEVYDKKYFESSDGAHYFAKEKTAPKFIYAINISGLTDGDSVLDIGCGRGDLMIALAHKGANVTGIDYSKDALEIAKKAISKKTGARGLRSILENILLKTMFELPDMENVIKVTVDKASVKGSSEPIVTYGKKSSTSVA